MNTIALFLQVTTEIKGINNGMRLLSHTLQNKMSFDLNNYFSQREYKVSGAKTERCYLYRFG